MDLERFDPALLGVAQQVSAAAGPGENPIDTLLDIYFGFLRRKTDFFRRVLCAVWRGVRGRWVCASLRDAARATHARAVSRVGGEGEGSAARGVLRLPGGARARACGSPPPARNALRQRGAGTQTRARRARGVGARAASHCSAARSARTRKEAHAAASAAAACADTTRRTRAAAVRWRGAPRRRC
jgi:hypothetical protein